MNENWHFSQGPGWIPTPNSVIVFATENVSLVEFGAVKPVIQGRPIFYGFLDFDKSRYRWLTHFYYC